MVNLSLRWLLESPGGQASGIRLIVLFRLIVNFTDSEYILMFYKDGWVGGNGELQTDGLKSRKANLVLEICL